MTKPREPDQLDEVISLRTKLWDAGYFPVPVYNHDAKVASPGKQPAGKNWQKEAKADPPEAISRPDRNALNTGILSDGLRPIDIDIDEPSLVMTVCAVAFDILGEAPIRCRGNSPRRLLPYRALDGEPAKRVLAGSLNGVSHKIEVLGKGQQFVAFGTHASGAKLQWWGETLGTVRREALTAVSEDQISQFLNAVAPLIGAIPGPRLVNGHAPRSSRNGSLVGSPHDLAAALDAMRNDGPANWDFWNTIGMAAWNASGGSGSGFDAWTLWSAKHSAHDDAACLERWRHYAMSPPTMIGMGTLVYLARDAMPGWQKPSTILRQREKQETLKTEAKHRSDSDWRDQLLLSEKDKPLPLLTNAEVALKLAPEWFDALRFDVFHQKTVLISPPPWRNTFTGPEFWSDTHDIRTASWLQRQGIRVQTHIVAQAVDSVSKDHKIHPVLDYLNSCVWDGVCRLDEWAVQFLGVSDTPYVRAVSAKWMISAVARVHAPGCKADCALILEGPQGILKSTAVRTLSTPWFTDDLAEFGSKDAGMQVNGAWIIELAELDALGRSEIKQIKAFMSRRIDRFRPPYGRRVEEFPRQCVFIGTCNMNDYLLDETGGRRFWPLECTKIDIDGLAATRDQLWAEAQHRYFDSETWWLDTPDIIASATVEQRGRYQQDAWQPIIEKFLLGCGQITITEILQDAIGISKDKWGRTQQMQVSKTLKSLGWTRKKTRESGWIYVAPVPNVP